MRQTFKVPSAEQVARRLIMITKTNEVTITRGRKEGMKDGKKEGMKEGRNEWRMDGWINGMRVKRKE